MSEPTMKEPWKGKSQECESVGFDCRHDGKRVLVTMVEDGDVEILITKETLREAPAIDGSREGDGPVRGGGTTAKTAAILPGPRTSVDATTWDRTKAALGIDWMFGAEDVIAVATKFRETLEKITKLGAVCEHYETCDHRPCSDSCGAVLLALEALGAVPTTGPLRGPEET